MNTLQISSNDAKQLQLEKKIAARIMAMNPGVGEKSLALAESFVECGLTPSMSAMLLEAVFTPPSLSGKGHGTRWKRFSAAVQRRYSGRLEKIQNNLSAFRSFLAEIDEMNEMRDILKGEGFGFSFERAFLFSEIGLDADSCTALLCDMISRGFSVFKAQRVLFESARMVSNRQFSTVEAAIEEMTHD